MKPTEKQLIAAMLETSVETDFSVSVAVLKGIGLGGEELQLSWLVEQRPPVAGKNWHRIGDRWTFGAPPSDPESEPSFSLPGIVRNSNAARDVLPTPVAVKPVAPLRR